MTKSLIAFAALAAIFATSAQAKPHLTLHRSDEVKPPVFVFAAKPTTETRALIAAQPGKRVWTDDYRPAPPSFYANQAALGKSAVEVEALTTGSTDAPVAADEHRSQYRGYFRGVD